MVADAGLRVPYSLTEEFAAVHRVHPVMPDLFDRRSHEDDHRYRAEPYSLRERASARSLGLFQTVPNAFLPWRVPLGPTGRGHRAA